MTRRPFGKTAASASQYMPCKTPPHGRPRQHHGQTVAIAANMRISTLPPARTSASPPVGLAGLDRGNRRCCTRRGMRPCKRGTEYARRASSATPKQVTWYCVIAVGWQAVHSWLPGTIRPSYLAQWPEAIIPCTRQDQARMAKRRLRCATYCIPSDFVCNEMCVLITAPPPCREPVPTGLRSALGTALLCTEYILLVAAGKTSRTGVLCTM